MRHGLRGDGASRATPEAASGGAQYASAGTPVAAQPARIEALRHFTVALLLPGRLRIALVQRARASMRLTGRQRGEPVLTARLVP